MSAKDLEFDENTSLSKLREIESNLNIGTAYSEVYDMTQGQAGDALRRVRELIKEKEKIIDK